MPSVLMADSVLMQEFSTRATQVQATPPTHRIQATLLISDHLTMAATMRVAMERLTVVMGASMVDTGDLMGGTADLMGGTADLMAADTISAKRPPTHQHAVTNRNIRGPDA
jgi:hypothetical protein